MGIKIDRETTILKLNLKFPSLLTLVKNKKLGFSPKLIPNQPPPTLPNKFSHPPNPLFQNSSSPKYYFSSFSS